MQQEIYLLKNRHIAEGIHEYISYDAKWEPVKVRSITPVAAIALGLKPVSPMEVYNNRKG